MPLVNVDKLISETKPMYKDTWAETVNYMLNDSYHKGVIAQLSKELDRDGSFRKPVVMTFGEDDDNKDVKYVSNGTHRVIATLVHDLVSEVNVIEGFPEQSETDVRLITTDLFISSKDKKFSNDSDFDDLLDELMFVSAPLNSQVWIATDGGSAHTKEDGHRISVWWDAYGDEIDEVDLEEVNRFMFGLAESIGLKDFSVDTYIDTVED